MLTEIVACASIGISYGKLGEPVPVDETAIYIKKTTIEEILFTIAFFTETLASLIAGYLIIQYSRNEKSNLREDPVTGMEVPSLIFVFNQQQMLDCVAGVRTETPEQYKERMNVYNKEYVE